MDYGDFFSDYEHESEDAIHGEYKEFSQKELKLMGCKF